MNNKSPVPELNQPFLRLHSGDNIVVARQSIGPDEDWTWHSAPPPRETIRRGHKMALRLIETGEAVIKYGQKIGYATEDIAAGAFVHTHNLTVGEVELDYAVGIDAQPVEMVPCEEQATFMGYSRPDGRAGTRNYIALISSVNCSATVTRRIAAHFDQPGALDEWPGVDGVIALTHSGGCALDLRSEGYRLLTQTMVGYAANPNVGGVLMIGLGCETNQIPMILERHGLASNERLQTFTIQETGGTRASVEAGIEAVREMAARIGQQQRVKLPASHLRLGLQCGGSDGYSGITANPALGFAADLLVRHGGTAVLSETPEIYGAEHLLTRRAVSPETAQALLDRIDWWRDYTAIHGAEMDNNPSHGNKMGGLTTILEKSLGAVAKAGSAPLAAVYKYAERIEQTGFVYMDTPGYDPVSATGQVAGGCNLVAFTTGRGSVSGFKPAPTLKIATNNQMFARMEDDMDINCGGIATGEDTIEAAGARMFQRLLEIASGSKTKSEELGYGDNEFVPWPIGAVM